MTLAATAVLWLVLGLALRSAERAALIVSLVLVLFFLYGHVANALGPRRIRTWELLVIWLLVLALGTWLAIRARGSRTGITVFLNLASAAILVMNLPAAIRNPVTAHRSPLTAVRGPAAVGGRRSAVSGPYPDIYYIILDAYARSDMLKSIYSTDNSGFLRDLEGMGFSVPSRAKSNYSQTYLSMASSLNLNYLDSLGVTEVPEPGESCPADSPDSAESAG